MMLFPTTACPVSFLFVLSKELQKPHSLFLKHEVCSGAPERGAMGASAPCLLVGGTRVPSIGECFLLPMVAGLLRPFGQRKPDSFPQEAKL